jgi:two-component sensor histidine kinase
LPAQEPAPHVWRPEHLRLAVDAASVALWSWNVASNRFTMDERAFDLWGLTWAPEVTFEALSAHIHPADRDRVRAAFEATRSIAAAFEIDFRIVVSDDVRWISARGQGAEAGAHDGLTFGIFIDVTNRKQAEESHELLAGEMSHRVKNLLAIATSLTHLTSRSSASIAEMTTALTERLTALGRAHEVVRPLPGDQGKAALLGDLFSVLLAPYDDEVAFASRIRVAVPRLGIGERTATTLALVIHEMATNSVKHGALSAETGIVDVSSATDGRDLVLTWAETGGPSIDATPDMKGFGSKMIARSIAHDLDGTLNYDWQPNGLVATLRVRKDRLAA